MSPLRNNWKVKTNKTNTNKVNKTRALLQITRDKDEPNFVFMH